MRSSMRLFHTWLTEKKVITSPNVTVLNWATLTSLTFSFPVNLQPTGIKLVNILDRGQFQFKHGELDEKVLKSIQNF